jgi:hypothetical protein
VFTQPLFFSISFARLSYFIHAFLPHRHQQGVEGQAQSTATSNTVVTTKTNTVNAGPYIPVPAPTAVQRLPQPLRPPFMAQQQRPIRSQGPSQLLSGIPSYPSQIEGLSVSQAVVNDVLVDLQTKVLNESLQQYQQESSSGSFLGKNCFFKYTDIYIYKWKFLEPLPPIYIRAPQPTVILRSDLHRLRAELGNRVRPPGKKKKRWHANLKIYICIIFILVVYRHPAGANQFQQQHRFQQNTFQAPRFPAPPQQHTRPGI